MSRKVKLFGGGGGGVTVKHLQAWLEACDADKQNEYDIGDPIPFHNIYLLVSYTVEPMARGPLCPACKQAVP